MSWNPLFACLITSDCLPETQPARPSPARFESSVPNELHNSGGRARFAPPLAQRAAPQSLRPQTPAPALVTMVRVSLVAMVRVSPTPADNPPTTHRPTQKLLW